MNIKDFLNSPGVIVKNPNKKSKKDGQPDTITVPFTKNNTSNIYSQANEEFGEKGNILEGVDDINKYEKHNITITRNGLDYKPGTEFRNIDFELADKQSNWTKAGNAIAQTVVDELVLGTVQAFTDLAGAQAQMFPKLFDWILDKVFDVKNDPIQSALGIKDDDYSNPLSAKIEEWREAFRNKVAPVYVTPGVDIANGGFSNFGWYMSNMPSIMSSLTLLVPTKAATLGVSKIASLIRKANTAKKAAKAINKAVQAEKLANATKLGQVSRDVKELSHIQRFINNPLTREKATRVGKDLSESLLMRTIENYQEAHQTYQDMFSNVADTFSKMSDKEYNEWCKVHKEQFEKEGVDLSDKEAVAKHIAAKAADRTFTIDYSNIVFDFFQLHAIRDVGKLAKNVKSASVKRMHRASKQLAGKTNEEATKAIGRTKWKKTREYISDFVTGAPKQVLSELSEGVEEGINYIAQQEGITYGNTLLSLESDTTKGGFWNTRLSDYLNDSEFYESAFWGVAGGVIFGEGMNAYQKAAIARRQKKLNKQREENKKTGEQTVTNISNNPLNDFISLGEMPEIKAAKESIARRQQRATDLSQKLKLIEDGKNPNIVDPETGNYIEIGDDPVAKELLKAETIRQFRSDVAFDALNSGTYELLVDYLQDENVKQMFVDSGVSTKEDIDKFISETINDLEVVKNAYNKELAHVNSQVTALNAAKPDEGKIPLEYVQHIARINAVNTLKVADLDRRIDALDSKATELANEENDVNNLFDHKRTIRLAMLTDALGRLEADKRALQTDDEIEAWQKAENLAAIKNQQDGILQEILKISDVPYREIPLEIKENSETRKATNQETALGAALSAIRIAKAYEKVGDIYQGNQSETNTEFAKSDEDLIKEYEHIFKDSKTNTATLSQLSQLIDQDLDTVSGNEEGSLYNRNKKLYDAYTQLADLEIQRNIAASQISHSQSQIQEHVDIIHNRLNTIRKEKIKQSEKVIRDLHTKYIETNAKDVELAVIKAYMNDKQEAIRIARENLTGVNEDGHSDAEKLIDALSIINFTYGANQEAFTYIMQILRKNAEKYRESGKINTIFQKPQQAQQNQQSNSSTNQAVTSLFGEDMEENEPSMQQNELVSEQTINNDSRNKSNVELEVTQNGTRIVPLTTNTTTENSIPILDNGNRTAELAISALPREKQTQHILNPALFGEINTDVLNSNVELSIIANPTIGYDAFNKPVILEEGSVMAVNKTTGEVIDIYGSPVEENKNESEPNEPTSETNTPESNETSTKTQQTSSTGEEVQTPISDGEINEAIVGLTQKYILDNNLEDIDKINDFEALRNHLKNALALGATNGRYTKEKSDQLIDEWVNSIKQDIEELRELKGNDLNAGRIAMYSRYEELDTTDFSPLFKAAVEAFINEYGKHFIISEINGKPAIRIRDILTACNQLKTTSSTDVGINLYKIVTAYLLSEEGRQKYEVIDANDTITGSIINQDGTINVKNKTDSASTVVGEYRLNINSFIQRANATNDKQYFNALKNLKSGDNLAVEVARTEYKTVLEFKTSDGVIIGNMPLPKVLQENGALHYLQYNDGWRTSVSIDANGNVTSRFYNMLQYMFFNDHEDCKAIRKLLLEHKGDLNASGQALAQIPLIQKLVQESKNAPQYQNFIFLEGKDKHPDYARLFRGIYNLWAYTYNNTSGSPEVVMQQMRDNLYQWFAKLYDTYKTTVDLANTTNKIQAIVSYNSDGELALVVPDYEENKEDAYKQMPLVSDALVDPNKAHIAIVDNGQIVIADEAQAPESGVKYSNASTLIAVNGNSGKPQFAKAFGLQLSGFYKGEIDDNPKTEKAQKLASAFGAVLFEHLNALEESTNINDIEKAKAKLQQFLEDTIANKNIGLFRAKNGQTLIRPVFYKNHPGIKGIEISLKKRDGSLHSFQITITDRASNPKLGYKSDGGKLTIRTNAIEVRRKLYKFLLDNYQFDVSLEGIKADAKLGEYKSNNVFRKDENGKFVVSFRTPYSNKVVFEETYNSYNDFLFTNNLLRVNVKKTTTRGEESNFTDTSANQRGNQIVMVKLSTSGETAQTSSSEKTIPAQDSKNIVSETSDKDTFEQIKNAVPTRVEVLADSATALADKPNQAQRIIEITAGRNTLDEFNQVAEEMGIDVPIFPERIMYDPYFNEGTGDKKGQGFIAATNPTNKAVTYHQYGRNRRSATLQPGWVVIGNKLINMLSSTSIERRNRGISKLLHERIHQLINDPNITPERTEAFTALGEIYKLYKDRLSKDIEEATRLNQSKRLQALTTLKALLENVTKRTNNENIDPKVLEEFLVEGMTNNLLYEYLNRIEYTQGTNEILDEYDNNNPKQSLFSKLMDLIARIFGFNKHNDNTLNEKFYQVLRTLGNNNIIESEETSSPIEETTDTSVTENESEINTDIEEDDSDEILGLDEDDIEADFSSVEEVSTENLDIQISGIDAIRVTLPTNIHNNFNNLVETGFLEFKCV